MEENNQCGYYADPECIYSQKKKKEMNIDLWLSLGILICGHSRWMQKTNIKHGAFKKTTFGSQYCQMKANFEMS